MINEHNHSVLMKLGNDDVQIFGGAAFVHDINDIVKYLPYVINISARKGFDIAENCRKFCYICSTDPVLVEAYMGITFEELGK